PFARFALHLQQAAEERQAFAHPEEPEVPWPDPGLAPLLGREAVAVIGDVDLERVLRLQQREAHLVGRGVLLYVVEGLDRDAVERRLRLARKRTRVVDRLLECPAGLVGHVARRG